MVRGVLVVITIGACVSGISAVRVEEDRCVSEPMQPAEQLPRSIFANGVVEGRGREAMLRFETSGRLTEIRVRDGDRVSKGDVLAQLDSTTWRCDLAQAEASLALQRAERERLVNGARRETRDHARSLHQAAVARLAQAEKHAARAGRLQQVNALAQQELDDLTAAVLTAKAEVEASAARAAELEAPAREDELRMIDAKIALELARVSQAQAMLQKTTLQAPCDGIVLRVQGEIGEIVSQATPPTVTMADNAELHVRAFVEELDALNVSVGQSGFVTADGAASEKFNATVISSTPYMATKKVFDNAPGERMDVKVREIVLRLDHQDRLVIGLPVDVRICVDDAAEAAAIRE